MSFRRLLLLVVFLVIVAPRLSQADEPKNPKPQPSLTVEEQKLHLAAFDQVWETIRDKHWDPKHGGLDWDAVRVEYRPQIEKVKTANEARDILRAMLGRLKQSHFSIIPAEAYSEIKGKAGSEIQGAPKEEGPARHVTGLEVRVLGDEAIVTGVDPGLGASKAGVKAGWAIVKVRDEELAPVLKRVRAGIKDSKRTDRELVMAVQNRLRGHEGKTLPVTFRDGQDKEVTLDIVCGQPRGVAVKFGNMPTMFVHHESKTVAGDIRYFSLNTFFDGTRVMKAFEQTVQDGKNGAGFIIDIRGNPGGIGLMAAGFGNWFISGQKVKLGTLHARDSHINFLLNPRAETCAQPLAILVDGLSGSTSEILAGGMQDLKRARIFGVPTMGAALPSIFERLPTGDGFQYAIANYISTGGKALEGRGVIPDETVTLNRAALLQGRDPVLDAAVRWIRAQKKTGEKQP